MHGSKRRNGTREREKKSQIIDDYLACYCLLNSCIIADSLAFSLLFLLLLLSKKLYCEKSSVYYPCHKQFTTLANNASCCVCVVCMNK